MTVLIAGGDSFTYGSELPSQEHAWANLVATRKGGTFATLHDQQQVIVVYVAM